MRKLGVAIGIFFIAVISGIVIFAVTFDVNRYRGTIQSDLANMLGWRDAPEHLSAEIRGG
jgi:uncharacterized protein involved in outer membrane biogenesis